MGRILRRCRRSWEFQTSRNRRHRAVAGDRRYSGLADRRSAQADAGDRIASRTSAGACWRSPAATRTLTISTVCTAAGCPTAEPSCVAAHHVALGECTDAARGGAHGYAMIDLYCAGYAHVRGPVAGVSDGARHHERIPGLGTAVWRPVGSCQWARACRLNSKAEGGSYGATATQLRGRSTSPHR